MTIVRNFATIAPAANTTGYMATANLAGTITNSQLAGSITSDKISSITSSHVTTALGFTPYNSTNPSGYVTSSTAPVTSVNGQTGAVVTTSLNSIGSVQFLATTSTVNPLLVGGTVAGSSLYYATGYNAFQSNQVYLEGTSATNPNSSTFYSYSFDGNISGGKPGNTGIQPPSSNVTTVSGTWRLMKGYRLGASSQYITCCGQNYTNITMPTSLYVRVS